MESWETSEKEIESVEKILLPKDCHFANDAKNVIRYWQSVDVAACPGSGKTTVLLAKLKLLADRMPLQNGAGVCVLSHTNVAVNEIKTKLADYADILMNYPNYVGTIQSFIDQFVTKPHLKNKTNASIQVVEDAVFAQHLYNLLWKDKHSSSPYQSLRYLIRFNVKNGSGLYHDEVSYIEKLYQKGGALYVSKQNRALAGADKPSAQQYVAAIQELLVTEGMIRYKDAYQYAIDGISELSDEYTELLRRRFQYVFIDEYQDCNRMQRAALKKLFDSKKACVFHIGDPDQAIYNSNDSDTEDWIPDTNCLSMVSSNRYGQEIADVLTNLRSGKEQIRSSAGNTGYPPTLIVFDDGSIDKVIEKFIFALNENKLFDPEGIYKVIGSVKRRDLAGLKIGDYRKDFNDIGNSRSEYKYWNFVNNICEELLLGRLYRVENQFRRLLCRVFHYAHVINTTSGKEYNFNTIKRNLDEKCHDIYRDGILRITKLTSYDRKSVDYAIRTLISELLDSMAEDVSDIFKSLPEYFMEEMVDGRDKRTNHNIFVELIQGRRIEFDTVHGVKGETHDATLYLETERGASSDIKRILPYLDIGKQGSKKDAEYSRKCVYVGMSRPRKLLCVAVKDSTYQKAESIFQTWNIIDCRNK